MRIRPVFLILILFLASALTARAGEPVKVCFENWRPYYFLDAEGRTQGVVLDLVRDSLAAAGKKPSSSTLPPKRCRSAVAIGASDMILTIEKAEDGMLLGETALSFWVIAAIVPKSSPQTAFEGLPHYRGKRALLISDYVYPPTIRQFASQWTVIDTQYIYSTDQSLTIKPFRMVEVGRADLFLEDMQWADRVIHKHDLDLKVLRPAVAIAPGYIGYSAKRPELRSLIEGQLSQLAADGSLDRLYREKAGMTWSHPDAPPVN